MKSLVHIFDYLFCVAAMGIGVYTEQWAIALIAWILLARSPKWDD